MNEFLYYSEPALTSDQEDTLSNFGQFYSKKSDFVFLVELRSGRAKRKKIDKWFNENEGRMVWFLAQGILASVYGTDPP